MSSRHADIKGIEWRLQDVTKMESVPSGSIDVAFDKGTLDAMIHGSPWSPPQDVVDMTAAYIQEVCANAMNETLRNPLFAKTYATGVSCAQERWSLPLRHL